MTYRSDCTFPDELLEQIADQGLDLLPELVRTFITETSEDWVTCRTHLRLDCH